MVIGVKLIGKGMCISEGLYDCIVIYKLLKLFEGSILVGELVMLYVLIMIVEMLFDFSLLLVKLLSCGSFEDGMLGVVKCVSFGE